MIFAFLGAKLVEIPFPKTPVFQDGEQRVCLLTPAPFQVDSTEVEDSGFRVTCDPLPEGVQACVSVMEGTAWPKRVPEFTCPGHGGKLVVRAVIGFDPAEDIEDGVEIVAGNHPLTAAFRTSLPDAPGILDGGACGVTRGYFWVEMRPSSSRTRSCTLILEEGGAERDKVVLVRIVNKL